MMKFKLFFLVVVILLAATACSEEQGDVVDNKITNPAIEYPEEMPKAPPNLKVAVDGIEVSAILGAHAWSYFDEEENARVSVEAETISPLEIAMNQKAPPVNEIAVIELRFEKEPNSYGFYIWGSKHRMKGPYSKIILDESTGKTVYEVVAAWEQGTAHYVFSLTIE
ncbi:hypothetical protein [Planococcus antarcticus]|nr:hypothetical protein [Planococcus antarcticus]